MRCLPDLPDLAHLPNTAPVASQKERCSAWKPKGVSVRLKAPLRAIPAQKRSVRARRLAVMKAPYELRARVK